MRRNKTKILLIIIPILLLVIAGTVLGVLYFTTDLFKSNQELFAKYFIQNGEIFEMLENANLEEQNTFKTSNSYTGTGELTLNVQNGSNTQTIKANTASVYDANTKRKYNRFVLKNADSDLLEVSYINSDDVYAIKCSDIVNSYIGFRNSDLKTFAKNMGASEADIQKIPDMIEFTSINDIGKITSDQKQHIIDTYSKVILESIPKEKYSKIGRTQIAIEGVTYETNGYRLTLEPEITNQMIINCLTTLKSDNTTLVMISNKLSALGIESSYTDITKLAEIINNIIEKYQNNNSNNSSIEIELYENAGKAIRTSIKLSEGNQIIIDKTDNDNLKKVIITIEAENDTNTNTMNGTELNASKATISQVILQKAETATETTNEITFIPDTNNKVEQMSTKTIIGKIQGDIFTNTSTATVTMPTGGVDIETTSATYTQTLQKANQVQEIMELKNSNTIIVNNYTKEQLMPFLTSVGNKVETVLPNKIAQLGIDFGLNQNANATNGLAGVTNTIYKIVQIVGTTGVSIANVNGIDIVDLMGVTGVTSLGIFVNNSAQNSINDAMEDISAMEVQSFNAKFLNYAGEQKGSTIKSLCDIIKANNASELDEQVTLQMSSATNITSEPTTITSESIDVIKQQIQVASTYIVDFGYSSTTGKIVAIGIVQK